MTVERATEATAELVEALARLTPQLTTSSPAPSREDVAALIDGGTHLFLFRDGRDTLVGSLAMAVYRTPTGVKAVIEDVVVDGAARGRGVGEALTRAAMDAAVEAGARSVSLTSRPEREAANRLYRRLGFELRETNVYVWRAV